MYSSPIMIKLRSIARRIGLTRAIVRIRGEAQYEERFSNAMLSAIYPGAVVWDVGANVGFYSAKFSDRVGVKRHQELTPWRHQELTPCGDGVVLASRCLDAVRSPARRFSFSR